MPLAQPITWDDISHLIGRGPYKIASSDDVPNLASGSAAGWTDSGSTIHLTTAANVVSLGGAGSALAGTRFTIVNEGANAGAGVSALAGSDNAYRVLVAGDTNSRLQILATGAISWGSGSAAADTRLYRSGTKILSLDDGTGGTATELLVNLAGSDTTPMVNVYKSTIATATIVPMVTLALKSGGAAATGLGTSLDFTLANSSGGLSTLSGRVACVVTTPTAGSENSDLRFSMQTGSTSGAERWRMQGSDGSLRMMSNSSIVPHNDGQGNVGTSTNRFVSMTSNSYNVFAAPGDANASTAMSSSTLRLGVGGGTALDVKLTRSAASTLQIDNNAGGTLNVVPATDNTGSIGTPALRFALVRAVTITSGFLGETETFEAEDLDLDGKIAALREDMTQREFAEAPGQEVRHNARVTFVGARAIIEMADIIRGLQAQVADLLGRPA